MAGMPSQTVVGEADSAEAEDPALRLARLWRDAHKSTLALCRLQQRLETRLAKAVDDPASPPAGNPSEIGGRGKRDFGYSQAKDAEARAAEASELLLEELARTPAQTIDGVVAKLEVVLLEGKISGAPSSFPWPQLQSVLEDLRRLLASPTLSEARE